MSLMFSSLSEGKLSCRNWRREMFTASFAALSPIESADCVTGGGVRVVMVGGCAAKLSADNCPIPILDVIWIESTAFITVPTDRDGMGTGTSLDWVVIGTGNGMETIRDWS